MDARQPQQHQQQKGSRFENLDQYEGSKMNEDDRLDFERSLKQKEFYGFIREMSSYCFQDCVKDFTPGLKDLNDSEDKCLRNCIMQTMNQQPDL